VDLECLAKLAIGQNCDFPISVAIPFGEQFEDGDYMRVEYLMEGLSSVHNYWLFHSATNQTERIAIKKYVHRL
jgi:ribosomal protein L33